MYETRVRFESGGRTQATQKFEVGSYDDGSERCAKSYGIKTVRRNMREVVSVAVRDDEASSVMCMRLWNTL